MLADESGADNQEVGDYFNEYQMNELQKFIQSLGYYVSELEDGVQVIQQDIFANQIKFSTFTT